MGTSALVFAEDAGVDLRNCAHAAMSHVSELQLIVARHLDKRTPAENPFEAGPEPEPKPNRAAVYVNRNYICMFWPLRALTCC